MTDRRGGVGLAKLGPRYLERRIANQRMHFADFLATLKLE